jgi:hypothetical protein
MQIRFVKNIQFTKLVKADGRLKEFNFRKMNNEEEGPLFTVDVADERGNRIIFRMKKNDTNWKIVEPHTPLPDWVKSNENILHEHIEEEMRNI